MTIIVFGVTGAGKSFIGRVLAQHLGWSFHDADDFHPAANVEKMRLGVPLTDDDRWPWLERLRQLIGESQQRGVDDVLACSALKRTYRQRLAAGLDVRFVYLKGDHALIAERLRQRSGHFMNPGLLDSQFETLEEAADDERAIVVDVADTPETIVRQVEAVLKGGKN